MWAVACISDDSLGVGCPVVSPIWNGSLGTLCVQLLGIWAWEIHEEQHEGQQEQQGEQQNEQQEEQQEEQQKEQQEERSTRRRGAERERNLTIRA